MRSQAASYPQAVKGIPLAPSVGEELWRRSQTRREAALYPDVSDEDRLLLPLVLSLARLAAQRDAKVQV
jgi:hypothetical protein